MIPPPGAQVGAGRIRVDAARAIAKLREYQLVDRAAWVLEAIRAAVAAGATSATLTGDADDVWLAWSGEPLADALLPHLFDELVSPEAVAERHHVRLLAAGVNSALGLDPPPRFVDVYAIDGNGTARRVRYAPEDLDEDGLRALTVEPADGDPLVANRARGMLVHLHRRASIAVVARFLLDTEPPELAIARAACRDLAIPLTVANDVVGHVALAADDVVRVPLGNDLAGFLAITTLPPPDAYDWDATIALAERGVVLAREAIVVVAEPRAHVPMRALLDAPRLPTDASRSQVRRDSYPIPQAIARAREIVPAAIAALVDVLRRDPTELRARTAALALLAATGAGRDRAWERPPTPFDALAKLPILHDATGAPRAPDAGWSGLVYTGSAPVEAALAPWVATMLWSPAGDPSRRLFRGATLDAGATRRALRYARSQRRAHDRFFAHATRTTSVVARREPRVRIALACGVESPAIDSPRPPPAIAVDNLARAFTNLTGEVCVYTEPGHGELVVLWQGRELERIVCESAIAFDALIDATDLTPGAGYRTVQRDAAYDRMMGALRLAVYRAVELVVHATQGGEVPRGCTLARVPPPIEVDAELVRRALALGRSLSLRPRGPLATAPAWETSSGRWVTLDELRLQRAVGVIEPGVELVAPHDRLIVRAGPRDWKLLGDLLPAPPIAYAATHVAMQPVWLAAPFISGDACALVIDDAGPGLAAVIATGSRTRLTIRHRGIKLFEATYHADSIPCSIALDSDAVVPSATWDKMVDDAGLGTRDFRAWEDRLVRAILATFGGDRSPHLLGDAPLGFGTRIGDLACAALARAPERVRLGAATIALLRAIPLVRLLGEPEPRPLDQLAALFPAALVFVPEDTAPVAGYHAIATTEVRARALAVLLGIPARDGSVELGIQRTRVERDARLVAHRAKPEIPLALPPAATPGGPTIDFETAVIDRAVLGIGRDGLAITVHVEGRHLTNLLVGCELPLAIAVELAVHRIDEAFLDVPQDVIDDIVHHATKHVAQLLRAIAVKAPGELVEGIGYPLLAAACARQAPEHALRVAIGDAVAFRTLRDELIALATARDARNVISIAAWDGEWLPPGEGEAEDALDTPILRATAPAFAVVLDTVHAGRVVDVTREVEKLQAHRRMARGLVPAPTLPAIVPEHKRKLRELGTVGMQLGHGEIGLASDDRSRVFVHANGVLARRIDIDVWPVVHVALESAELAGATGTSPVLADQIQIVAVQLARAVLRAGAGASVSPPIRRGFQTAALDRRMELEELDGIACFQLANTTWVEARVVRAQLELFGNVWALADAAAAFVAEPLDDRRRLFLVSRSDLARAKAGGVFVDATAELALDDKARANRDRPERDLAVAIGAMPTLALLELPGDGTTASRGIVALIDPAATRERGSIVPHRGGVPFARVAFECAWPTIAAIEDARFAPDRTWERVALDATWERATERVRAATDQLLATLGEAPPRAIASMRVDRALLASIPGPPAWAYLVLVGVMWLDRSPAALPGIVVRGVAGLPLDEDHGALRGRLFAYGAVGSPLTRAIDALSAVVHRRLVQQVIAAPPPELAAGEIAAHVAHALALGRLDPADAHGITFGCFAPAPLDADELAALFAGTDSIAVIDPGAPEPEQRSLVADHSPLAAIVHAKLGHRAYRARAPIASPPIATIPKEPAPEPAPPPRVIDPLQLLANALGARLIALGLDGERAAIEIVPRGRAPLWYERELVHGLVLCAEHPHVRAIEALRRANDPRFGAALDALAAHAVTVLNVELTEVTDSTEARAIAALLGAK